MITADPRQLWVALALLSLTAAALSFGLTEWRYMEACHLCIFQRLLFMLLAVLCAVAAIGGRQLVGQLFGTLAMLTAASGLGVAVYQSWIQLETSGSPFACANAEPGLIEQWVDWLGQQWPALFLATGFCSDAGSTVLGLTLANWAAIGFMVTLAVAAWALWRGRSRAAARD